MVTMGLIVIESSTTVNAMQCLGEDSHPVDWWFIYKMPGGFQFAYRDSRDTQTIPLSLSPNLLNRTSTGALGATLHQIYQGKQSNAISFVLWNDEHPDGTRLNETDNNRTKFPGGGGHTKGVLALDTNGGYYMLHSVPKFPDLRFTTFTWNASIVYGQTFLCLSLDRPTANSMATHLQSINPDLFDVHLPTPLAVIYPAVQALVSGTRTEGTHIFPFKTIGGTSFTAFGKTNKWGGDLYESLVEPTLKVGFDWQTWRRGSEMPTYCSPPSPYYSSNILTTEVGSYYFNYTRDHSKWGVAAQGSASTHWVCVGDINRMFSQQKRGGGTICTQSVVLHTALTDTIRVRQPC